MNNVLINKLIKTKYIQWGIKIERYVAKCKSCVMIQTKDRIRPGEIGKVPIGIRYIINGKILKPIVGLINNVKKIKGDKNKDVNWKYSPPWIKPINTGSVNNIKTNAKIFEL